MRPSIGSTAAWLCHPLSRSARLFWQSTVEPFFAILVGLCLATSGGCIEGSSARRAREAFEAGRLFVAQPTIRPNPIERVPLVAIVDIEASTNVTAALRIDDGVRSWRQPWPSAASQRHRVAAIGLKPDRKHTIRVELNAPEAGQTQLSEPLEFTTPPLPDSFPPLKVELANPEKMEPGLTMFAANIWRDSISVLDYGYIVIVDELGEVVWFCRTDDRIADMRILDNGHILYQHGNYRYAYEIDIMGRDIHRWIGTNLTIAPDKESIRVDIDTTHHDLLQMPDGDLLTLATELQDFDSFPTSEFDSEAAPAPAKVVCDAVVKFDKETGEIQERFHLRDVLDEQRIGYISLGGFWKDKYDYLIGEKARDWSHANSLLYLPEENAIIVSFRHLDCIYKIDWKTKEVKWILGNPDGWHPRFEKLLLKPKQDFDWFYHQHSPQLTPQGTLLLYDNGNYRARPFHEATMAPDNRSRVLELKIDEAAMTFETVYEYNGGDSNPFYCPFYCEADWLPKTNNLLITDGGHIETAGGTPDDDVPADRQWARIFEISREHDDEVVFEISLDSGIGSSFGWSIYRANRIPDLISPFRIAPPSDEEEVRLFPRIRHIKVPELTSQK